MPPLLLLVEVPSKDVQEPTFMKMFLPGTKTSSKLVEEKLRGATDKGALLEKAVSIVMQ